MHKDPGGLNRPPGPSHASAMFKLSPKTQTAFEQGAPIGQESDRVNGESWEE